MWFSKELSDEAKYVVTDKAHYHAVLVKFRNKNTNTNTNTNTNNHKTQNTNDRILLQWVGMNHKMLEKWIRKLLK